MEAVIDKSYRFVQLSRALAEKFLLFCAPIKLEKEDTTRWGPGPGENQLVGREIVNRLTFEPIMEYICMF